jgi:SAM-dependent methyltransferase
MGIDIETARFLLARRRDGVRFERCITLGRQHCFLGNKETRGLLKEFGLLPKDFPNLFPEAYPRYAEPFWEMLGAKDLATIDASDFEGATRVHDMNQPVPAAWHEAHDVVCDIGTLEHVFNFPVAIRNCLEMVKLGGHFFAQTPANNYFGHGFYQFSPELFFRVLSPANGFQIQHCVAVEYGVRRRWFAVTDPEAIRARVTLINAAPVVLLVWAKRVEILPLFRTTPQQSDYASAWAESATQGSTPSQSSPARQKQQQLQRALIENVPKLARTLESLRSSRFNQKHAFANRRSFAPITKLN